MGKKFMGLGGTDHFWDRAKAWILNQITSAVAAKIAEVVADAPEDLDTLKEIADWIKTHANDAAAMNTQITENKSNIAALSDDAAAMNTQITENKDNIATNTSDISALKTSVAGKADKSHTHTKSQITDFITKLSSGIDLNTITTAGEYIANTDAIANSLVNRPVYALYGCTLRVFSSMNGTVAQMIFSVSGIYFRYTNGAATWYSWKRVPEEAV